MKGITVFACLAALCATALSSGYVPGHQYVYEYQANIYTELKEQHHQHSGFFFKSKIYVQPVDGAYFFRVDDFAYDKINTRVAGIDSYTYNYREQNEVSHLLEKPFKAYVEHGIVKRLKFSKDETEFSINLKKGIAALFQLNFDQDKAIRTQDGRDLVKPDPRAAYYRVMEGSLIGECEVMYEITDDHNHIEPVLNVTKSRNYQNCVSQAYHFYHSAHYDQCAQCETVHHPIHLSDVYHYNLRGDRHHYIIDSVDSVGEFFYSPYTVNGDKPYTYVNRTLVYLYEKTSGEEIVLPSDAVTHYGLEYEGARRFDYHELVDLKKPHYLFDILHQEPDIEELGKLFYELLETPEDREFTEVFKTKNKPLHFAEFIDKFSTLSYEKINDFYIQFVNKRDEDNYQHYLNLFVDVLSATGTNPAFIYGKYLIHKHLMPANLVPHFLVLLPQSIKEVREILLDEFYRMCETDIHRNYPKLKSNCYLALSSLVYESCVSDYYTEITKFPSNAKSICSPEDAEKYFDYIVRDYDQVETNNERLTNIKVAGNFGIKKSVDYLKEYIEHSDHYPTYFRLSAIFSLKRVIHYYPEVIKNVLIPVYFNQSEPHELRIAAFVNLISTNLPLYQLDAIGQSLEHEPNHQVVAYVYSVFYHLSNSDYPCYKETKKNLQVVLRHLDRVDFKMTYDLRNSFSYFTNGYNEEFDFGGASVLSYVTSNDSYIPRTAYLGLSNYFGGKHFESFSVAYHGYGLDKFFDKIFGPEGLYTKKTSIFDYFRRRNARDTGSASVEKELKEIDEQLHIKPREYEPIQGDISVRVFGNEISFFHFDEQLLEEFLSDGAFGIGNHFNPLDITALHSKRYLLGRNTYLVMPLDIGIPVFLDYKEPVFYSVKNVHSKFEVSPSIFSEEREGKAPAHVGVEINANLISDTTLQATTGIILLFDHVKVGVGRSQRQYFSAPIKFSLNYDVDTHKATVKVTPVLDSTILHKCSKPFTYLDYYNNQVPVSLENTVLPYYSLDEQKRDEYNFFHDYFGYGINVVTRHGKLNHLASAGSFKKFNAENDFRTKSYYLLMDPHITAYEIEFRVTPADHDVTTEIEATIDFDFGAGVGIRDNRPQKDLIYTHEDGFEDHVKLYPGRKFYTYVVKGELVAKGTKERKVVLELSHTHSCDHQYLNYNAYFQRTPLVAEDTEPFVLCATANIRYPQYDMKKLFTLDMTESEKEINLGLNVNFGKDCKTDKKINLRGVLKQSAEQIELEHKRETIDHLHYNPYAHYYKKCIEARKLKQYYSLECRKYIYYTTKMHHYVFNLDLGSNMTPEFMNETVKWNDYFNHAFYYYMDQQRYGVENEKGKLHLEAIFAVTDDVVDISIERPRDRTHYHSLPVLGYLSPLSASPVLGYTNYVKFNHFFIKPVCTVQGDLINTFDNVSYTLPNIDCYKVVSKDCSEKEYFTVLGKKITHNRYAKAVKVFLGKVKVEALPVTEDSGIIVRVNGKKVVVTETEPYFHLNDKEVEIFRVVYNGLYYGIYSDYYGVEVFYDGKAIVTELSPYYRGKQCGLCGDFNNEQQHEFRGPENCIYHNITEFGYSYAIPDDTCEVPDIKNPCERQAHRPCSVRRNRYIYTGTRQRQMCFTTVPLPECSNDCVEGKKVTRNIGFHCLNAKDYFTRFLQRESRDRILHEVKNKPENHFADLEYPEECLPREV